MSLNVPESDVKADVYGKNAFLQYRRYNKSLVLFPPRGHQAYKRGYDTLSQCFQLMETTFGTGLNYLTGRVETEQHRYFRLFIESILNKRKPPVSVEDAVEVNIIASTIGHELDRKAKVK